MQNKKQISINANQYLRNCLHAVQQIHTLLTAKHMQAVLLSTCLHSRGCQENFNTYAIQTSHIAVLPTDKASKHTNTGKLQQD